MKHHRQISLSISLLLILNVHGVVGQEPVKAVFKFAPLSLIDPYGPNIQLGFEFIRQGKISFETDFAVYTQESKKGMKFRPEIRYYPSRRKTHLPGNGFYWADEMVILTNQYSRGDTFVRNIGDPVNQEPYYDYDVIDRFEIRDYVKVGFQKTFLRVFTFDSYFGVGVKYYHTDYVYKVPDPRCCPVIRLFESPTGKGFWPSLTMGIKLGFRIPLDKQNAPNGNTD